MKPPLSRGALQAIGATTTEEYRKHLEKDSALARRFQTVNVKEPSEEQALRILDGLRDRYEAHHHVRYSDEALQAAVSMSSRYIQDRFLPDKAIDVLDEAGARMRIRNRTLPASSTTSFAAFALTRKRRHRRKSSSAPRSFATKKSSLKSSVPKLKSVFPRKATRNSPTSPRSKSPMW